jgi:NADH-quinone oxidoreductase subunit M
MLVAFVYMYQKREAFIRRFIQIKLNSNRTIMDILGFLLSVCIKIPLIPFHTWQTNVYQKHQLLVPCLSGIMLKWDCTVLSVGNAIGAIGKKVCTFSWDLVAGVIYGSIVALKQKI